MSEEPRQPKSGLRPLTWWDGAWLALGLAVLIICRLLGVDVWAVLLLVIVVLFGPNIANRIDRIKRVSWGDASAEVQEMEPLAHEWDTAPRLRSDDSDGEVSGGVDAES